MNCRECYRVLSYSLEGGWVHESPDITHKPLLAGEPTPPEEDFLPSVGTAKEYIGTFDHSAPAEQMERTHAFLEQYYDVPGKDWQEARAAIEAGDAAVIALWKLTKN